MHTAFTLIAAAIFLGPAILIAILPGKWGLRRVVWAAATFLPAAVTLVFVWIFGFVLGSGLPLHGTVPTLVTIICLFGGWLVFPVYMKHRKHAS